jgi:hypothetical protein
VETKSENTEDYYREELHAIKEEIISLRNEFSQFLQKANQQQVPLQKIMILKQKFSFTTKNIKKQNISNNIQI